MEKLIKNRIIIFISCIIIALVVLPTVVMAMYTYAQADDFSNAITVGVYDGNVVQLFIASLKYSKMEFLSWQGTYTSLFMMAFLSPLNGFGTIQLRIIMLVNVLMFIASLALFIYSVCKWLKIEKVYIFTIITLCTVGIFGFTSWTEVFNWFTGAVNYSVPLSFFFLGIFLTINEKKLWKIILGAFLTFAASGGSLEVVGCGCFVLMSICLFKRMFGEVQIKDFCVFGCAVLGALINVAAPGNYVRHAVVDETGLHFGNALINTFCATVKIVEKLLFDTPIILILILSIFIGFYIGKSIKVRHNILWSAVIISVLFPFVTLFPVCLGYSGDGYIPNRCEFVETVSIVISIVLIFVLVGCLISEKAERVFTKELYLFMAMFLILMPNVNTSWKLSEIAMFAMLEQIGDNEFENYYDNVNQIYAIIAAADDENVFVYDLPDDINNFSKIQISEDEDNWVNTTIAHYYGKKTLQFIESPVYKNSANESIIRISPDMFESDLSYVSIFIKDSMTQDVEVVQLLEPLENNKIINIPSEKTGHVGIYVFADKDGKIQTEEMELSY